MNTSEFEGKKQEPENDCSVLSKSGSGFPADFSEEEVVFAQELNDVFNIDQEEMPPLFVQTLLAAEDERFQAPEDVFEKKTCVRVFRRLHLQRQIFRSYRSPFRRTSSKLPVRRLLMPVLAAFLLIVILSVVYTAPSFAAGLSMLLSGPHSGVLQVYRYPSTLASAPAQPQKKTVVPRTKRISLQMAQHLLQFPMYFPAEGALPVNYALKNVFIYEGNSDWADGPIMELDYHYSSPGAAPRASGRIAICEFKPVGQVLQLVEEGAAHRLELKPDGSDFAIYVDGHWASSINKSSPVWIYGDRSELIYERDGVVFWIVGDQRDGIDGKVLRKIAASLQEYDMNYINRMARNFNDVQESASGVPSSLAGNVIYLDDPDRPGGPALKVVGVQATQPAQSTHTHLAGNQRLVN
ncbi:MAG: hypothetical protein IMW89_03720 [Ktedonobacteraceae bacterium]|nr:hypothetical protein [Ktedonobacteraceae bacterium]